MLEIYNEIQSLWKRTIAEKYLVHEFAKYWYGVFEEYSNPGEKQFYFSITFGREDPVRCTTGLLGRIMKRTHSSCSYDSIDLDTGEFPAGCAYYPYPSHIYDGPLLHSGGKLVVIPLDAGLILLAAISVYITNNNITVCFIHVKRNMTLFYVCNLLL